MLIMSFITKCIDEKEMNAVFLRDQSQTIIDLTTKVSINQEMYYTCPCQKHKDQIKTHITNKINIAQNKKSREKLKKIIQDIENKKCILKQLKEQDPDYLDQNPELLLHEDDEETI